MFLKVMLAALAVLGVAQGVVVGATLLHAGSNVFAPSQPVVITTWNYETATAKAWGVLQTEGGSAVDAVEAGCSQCEAMQCRGTVGFGGHPDENGETTLDAMIMDGVTMNVGGVGALRRVRSAISVARRVLENTHHSLLTGSQATQFALQMGFQGETLATNVSIADWTRWKSANCQPNFWQNVTPDPTRQCGPYTPSHRGSGASPKTAADQSNHDTIGMVAMDSMGRIAVGTSTNGLRHKIPGRVGDSPIPGAGGFADQAVGAAAATGDGDIMMRFLPSFLAVELMRQGKEPREAASIAIQRIADRYPDFFGAVIVLRTDGAFSAACHNVNSTVFPEGFPLTIRTTDVEQVTIKYFKCT